jgi:hypothetical protein
MRRVAVLITIVAVLCTACTSGGAVDEGNVSDRVPPAQYPTRFAAVPPVGSRLAPAGEMVINFRRVNVITGIDSQWTVYADGRMVWQRWSDAGLATVVPSGAERLETGYIQQRLTRRGVELLRSRMLATGLFQHELRITWNRGDVDIQVRRGDQLRELAAYPESYEIHNAPKATPAQYRAVIKLQALIAGLRSWLPSSGWADPKIRPFVPSHYFVEVDLGPPEFSKLPSPAREMLFSALSQCDGVVTTAEARALVQALLNSGVAPSRNLASGVEYNFHGLGFTHPSLVSVLPLAQPQQCR